MKRKIEILLRILLALALFCGCFYVVDTTLEFKYDDGVTPTRDFYSFSEDRNDVLMLSSEKL